MDISWFGERRRHLPRLPTQVNAEGPPEHDDTLTIAACKEYAAKMIKAASQPLTHQDRVLVQEKKVEIDGFGDNWVRATAITMHDFDRETVMEYMGPNMPASLPYQHSDLFSFHEGDINSTEVKHYPADFLVNPFLLYMAARWGCETYWLYYRWQPVDGHVRKGQDKFSKATHAVNRNKDGTAWANAKIQGSHLKESLHFHICGVVALMAAIAPGRRWSCHIKKDEAGKNRKAVKVSTHQIGLACVSGSWMEPGGVGPNEEEAPEKTAQPLLPAFLRGCVIASVNHAISSRAGEESATICNVTGSPVRLKMPKVNRQVVFTFTMDKKEKTFASYTPPNGRQQTVRDLLPAVRRLCKGAREQANLVTDGAVEALEEVIRMLRAWSSHTQYDDTVLDIDTDESD